jgi:hypothetical protein
VAHKLHPEVRVLAYPSDDLPRTNVTPCKIIDDISQLVSADSGDGSNINAKGKLGAQDFANLQQWSGQTAFTAISPFLRVISLNGAGKSQQGTRGTVGPDSQQGVVGLALRSKLRRYNARVRPYKAGHANGNKPDGIGLNREYEPLYFVATRAVPGSVYDDNGNPIPRAATNYPSNKPPVQTRWGTHLADGGKHTAIYHSCEVPDDTVSVRTEEKWPANAPFYFEFQIIGTAGGDSEEKIRVEFGKGGAWSILISPSDGFSLQKRITNGKGTWDDAATLSPGPNVSFANDSVYGIGVERMGGHYLISVVVDNQAYTFDYLDEVRQDNPSGFPSKYTKNASWDAAPLKVTFAGVSADISVARIVYCFDKNQNAELGVEVQQSTGAILPGTSQEGEPMRASYTREVAIGGRGVSGTPCLFFPNGWGANKENGTEIKVTARVVQQFYARGLSRRAVAYKAELIAEPGGLESPFLKLVMGYVEGDRSLPSRAPADITPAVTGKISVSSGQPPDIASTEARVQVDRVLLDHMPPPSGNSWSKYLGKYHRLRIEAGWNRDDGTTDTLVPLFDGFSYTVAPSTNGFAQNTSQIVGRDAIMRLKKPWATIDTKYKAGDFLFAEKGILWGADMVQEILRITLGDWFADNLNGGLGPLAFFPARGHYPLIGTATIRNGLTMGAVPILKQASNGSLNFPPPFKQDAYSWIQQIAQLDHAVFFWGFPPGVNVTRPVPIYGRITEFLQAARSLGIYSINDCQIDANSIDFLLKTASSMPLPDRDITRAWVLSGKPPQGGENFLPSILSGQSAINPGPPDDPEDGGERTLIIENDIFMKLAVVLGGADGAQSAMNGIADLNLRQFVGVNQTEVSVSTTGDAALKWGREIRLKTNTDLPTGEKSDTGLGLHDIPLRATRVEHSIDVMGTSAGDPWSTTLTLQPISATGL